MNEVAEPVKQKSPFQFVAVVFHDFDRANYKLAEVPSGNKPYFYLDPFGLQVNDLAMVHNGTDFGVIRVMRCIEITDPICADKVHKPLLFQVNYDQDLVVTCMERIRNLKDQNKDAEMQMAIDKALGYNVDGSMTMARRRMLGLPPVAKGVEKDFPTEGD